VIESCEGVNNRATELKCILSLSLGSAAEYPCRFTLVLQKPTIVVSPGNNYTMHVNQLDIALAKVAYDPANCIATEIQIATRVELRIALESRGFIEQRGMCSESDLCASRYGYFETIRKVLDGSRTEWYACVSQYMRAAYPVVTGGYLKVSYSCQHQALAQDETTCSCGWKMEVHYYRESLGILGQFLCEARCSEVQWGSPDIRDYLLRGDVPMIVFISPHKPASDRVINPRNISFEGHLHNPKEAFKQIPISIKRMFLTLFEQNRKPTDAVSLVKNQFPEFDAHVSVEKLRRSYSDFCTARRKDLKSALSQEPVMVNQERQDIVVDAEHQGEDLIDADQYRAPKRADRDASSDSEFSASDSAISKPESNYSESDSASSKPESDESESDSASSKPESNESESDSDEFSSTSSIEDLLMQKLETENSKLKTLESILIKKQSKKRSSYAQRELKRRRFSHESVASRTQRRKSFGGKSLVRPYDAKITELKDFMSKLKSHL